MNDATLVRNLVRALVLALCAAASILVAGCDEPETTCDEGQCKGENGSCYGPCIEGAYCTTTPSGNCSAPNGGVYCCMSSGGGGGGGGCTPTGCPAEAPWRCGSQCYADPSDAGPNHSCIKCP